MEGWKTFYFPALAHFVRTGQWEVSGEIEALSSLMSGARKDAILKHHDESVRFLHAIADEEDRMTLVHRSLLFLNGMLAAHAGADVELAAAAGDSEAARVGYTSALERAMAGNDYATNKFETVLQQMDSGIALFDEAGCLRFLNVQMARFLNVTRRSLVGCTLRQLLFHSELDRHTRKFAVRLLKGMIRKHQFHAEYEDTEGHILLFGVSQSEALDGDYLVSVKDVSAYRQIEEAAFQNDKLAMLGKISAAIAHEIRNPLTSIRGFIQLLLPYLNEYGKQEYARIILSEIDRANDIISEFLHSSKPTAPMKQTVLVGLLLKETILLSESEAHMRGCELHYEIFDPYLTVEIDVKQIKQVLLNMTKNALDAIEEAKDGRKGKIEMSACKEGVHAVISIRDNGKGMDRQTLGRLFDPFFTTKLEGTGLGLSVCYRIITNHGGSVQVESQPNEGTEFKIYLPSTQ